VYEVPGFSSGTISYGLHWRNLEDVLTNTSDELCYRSEGYSYPGAPTIPVGACQLFDTVGSSFVAYPPALGVFNPVVLSQIDLPNGSTYKFTYDIYGQINKVEYPTGATETFEYTPIDTIANPGRG